MGYVLWPELVGLTLPWDKECNRLGYVLWPELYGESPAVDAQCNRLGYVLWPEDSMNPDNHAANDPDIDPVLTAILRYTMPVALVGILFTLLVIGWAFSL